MARPQTGRPRSGTTERLQSGRYRVRFTGPDGKRHAAPITFEDLQAARIWLAKEIRTIEDDPEGWRPPSERNAARRAQALTLGEYAEAWLPARKVKGRPLAGRTRDGYRDLLDRFILPTFADVPLTSITSDMVDAWYETCAIGRPTYQARAYGLLRTILGTAVDRGLIKTANPAKVRGGGTTKRRHKVKPATVPELAAIVEAMPDRRRLMIQLAAWCALRFGELAELRRGDVDTKNGLIHVRRGVTKVAPPHDSLPAGTKPCGCRPNCVVGPPKTDAGIRDVPIPPHLLADVRAHLLEHTSPGRDGLLFPGVVETDAAGKVIGVRHLTPSAFYGRAMTFHTSGARKGEPKAKGHGYFEARRLAGRPDLHLHDLRHTGLTNAAVAQATLAELMQMAGHSTPGAAMRYQHAAQDRMKDLAARLSALAEGDVGQS